MWYQSAHAERHFVVVVWIPLQGVKIAFRARYVATSCCQAQARTHTDFAYYSYNSQSVLAKQQRIKGDFFCLFIVWPKQTYVKYGN